MSSQSPLRDPRPTSRVRSPISKSPKGIDTNAQGQHREVGTSQGIRAAGPSNTKGRPQPVCNPLGIGVGNRTQGCLRFAPLTPDKKPRRGCLPPIGNSKNQVATHWQPTRPKAEAESRSATATWRHLQPPPSNVQPPTSLLQLSTSHLQQPTTNRQKPSQQAARLLPGILLLLFLVGLLLPSGADAQILKFRDLTVEDLSIAGPSERKTDYTECRFRITNLSTNKTRNVEFIAPSTSFDRTASLRPVRVNASVDARQTRIVSFFIPALPCRSSGEVRVRVGDEVSGIDVSRQFAEIDAWELGVGGGWGGHSPSSTERPVLLSPDLWQSRFRNSLEGSGKAEPFNSRQPLANWSPDWKAYSAYTIVAITGKEFDRLDPDVQRALVAYQASGGRVAFVDSTSEDWTQPFGPHASAPRTYPLHNADALVAGLFGPRAGLPDASSARRLLSLADSRIPFRGIFLIMLAFAILIGPVNVILLDRRRRRIWLLWTVPVFSLLTCGVIFAYSLFSEGVTARYASASLSYLDQRLGLASTFVVESYNCPIAPGRGLAFDTDTVLQPLSGAVTSSQKTFEYGGGEQRLRSGWVASRVPMQLARRAVTDTKLRLKIGPGDGASIEVTNGLGVELKSLLVTDQDGNTYEYKGAGIDPGARVTLKAGTFRSLAPLQNTSGAVPQTYTKIPSAKNLAPPPINGYRARLDGISPFAKPGLDRYKIDSLDGYIFGTYTPEGA